MPDSGDENIVYESIGSAIDWTVVFGTPPKLPGTPNVDGKDMSVKSDTPEDQERIWKAIADYARSGN